jgi:hypothetical protein
MLCIGFIFIVYFNITSMKYTQSNI